MRCILLLIINVLYIMFLLMGIILGNTINSHQKPFRVFLGKRTKKTASALRRAVRYEKKQDNGNCVHLSRLGCSSSPALLCAWSNLRSVSAMPSGEVSASIRLRFASACIWYARCFSSRLFNICFTSSGVLPGRNDCGADCGADSGNDL